MRFAFRADASLALGSGHVMRCLSLANELRHRGADTVFVSLDLPNHLAALLHEAGHSVHWLPHGARGNEHVDAETTLASVEYADAMVLDHYQLGTDWEDFVGARMPVLAVDDLGRAHQSRWLLDQNFYLDPPARYAGRLAPETTALLGAKYALLRPEFESAHRLEKVRDRGVHHVLVFLGGMDADNVTATALDAIALALPAHVRVTVIAGAAHPSLPHLRAWCQGHSDARLLVQVTDMSRFMLEADLAIAAGGFSTWERCATGLPAVTICVAENQRAVVQEGTLAGYLWGIDHIPSATELGDVLRVLARSPHALAGMSRRALEVTDGRGVQRVAELLMPRTVGVRPAQFEDARMIYDWRSAPSVQRVSRHGQAFTFEQHCDWLRTTLSNPHRMMLIGHVDGHDIGVVRFDLEGPRAEVSVFLAPERVGSGLGSAMLGVSENHLRMAQPQVRWIDAWVTEDNLPSITMFTRLGYKVRIRRLEKEIA